MIGRAIAFFLCIVALLLPHRLRCLLSEAVGWILQGIYFVYYGLLNFIMTELRSAEDARQKLESSEATPASEPAGSKE